MEKAGNSLHREAIEWCDAWITQCDRSELPRALLIGDSITRAYYPVAAGKLKGIFACARLASSKCAGDPGLLRELDIVLTDYKYQVIHFNNGMHGWSYKEEEYAQGLAALMDILISRNPDSRLIWANTTPVRSGKGFAETDAKTERVRERNRIAAGLAAERGIEINDLFSVVADHPEYHADGVHFNDAGNAVLGAQVAGIINKTEA